MARLPYLDVDDLPEDQQDLLKRPINLFRQMVHSPNAARKFQGLGYYIRFDSKLDPRLRELAILQVGYLTRSPYEYSHHLKIGRDFGVTEADIAALEAENRGEDSGLPELDRMVLRAATEITETRELSDATFAYLQGAFDNECLVDLVMVIAFYNGVVRFLGALQIDVEPDYQTYLDAAPLPT